MQQNRGAPLRRWSLIRWAVWVGLCMLAQSSLARTYTLGVLAFRPVQETQAHWQPVVDFLNLAVVGQSFQLKTYTYPELNVAIARKEVDFVLTNPAHYIELRHLANLSGALATVVDQVGSHALSEFAGTIFTLSSNPDIHDLVDLPSHRLAVPDASSLGGYHLQAFEMVSAGVDLPNPDHIYLTGIPHDRVVQAVLAGKADAGFVRAGVIEQMSAEGKIDLKRLRIVHPIPLANFPFAASTRACPEWPFIVLPHVDAMLSKRVASALLAYEPDASVVVGPRGFAVPADYSSVEEIMRRLRVPPFDAPLQVTVVDIWKRYEHVLIVLLVSSAIVASMVFRLLVSHRKLQKARQQTESVMARLTRQDEFLHNITENVPAAILYWDSGQHCQFANEHACKLLGQSHQNLLGMSLVAAIGRDAYLAEQMDMQAALAGQAREFERCSSLGNGASAYFLVQLVPDKQSSLVLGVFELIHDITNQKQAAEERIAWAMRQRDTLVREVHHRIKNNLQSVGSLLQRELGKFPEFAPRLKRAMNQLHTLSLVHGLQTMDSGERVGLGAILQQIVARQSDQTGRQIEFAPEGIAETFNAAQIVPTEAVALSLILNELLTNACKHSPHQSVVRVTTSTAPGATMFAIDIANLIANPAPIPGAARVQPDGAGFRLMRALLPLHGATLTFQNAEALSFTSRLELTSPVIQT